MGQRSTEKSKAYIEGEEAFKAAQKDKTGIKKNNPYRFYQFSRRRDWDSGWLAMYTLFLLAERQKIHTSQPLVERTFSHTAEPVVRKTITKTVPPTPKKKVETQRESRNYDDSPAYSPPSPSYDSGSSGSSYDSGSSSSSDSGSSFGGGGDFGGGGGGADW